MVKLAPLCSKWLDSAVTFDVSCVLSKPNSTTGLFCKGCSVTQVTIISDSSPKQWKKCFKLRYNVKNVLPPER